MPRKFQWWLAVLCDGHTNHRAVVWADCKTTAMEKAFKDPPATTATPLSWRGLSECVGCQRVPASILNEPADSGFLILHENIPIRIVG